MSEKCRVLYQINLRNSASRWFSFKNIPKGGNLVSFKYIYVYKFSEKYKLITIYTAHNFQYLTLIPGI
jgi:hypothetical protein